MRKPQKIIINFDWVRKPLAVGDRLDQGAQLKSHGGPKNLSLQYSRAKQDKFLIIEKMLYQTNKVKEQNFGVCGPKKNFHGSYVVHVWVRTQGSVEVTHFRSYYHVPRSLCWRNRRSFKCNGGRFSYFNLLLS